MINNKSLFKTDKAGLAVKSAGVLLALTGCLTVALGQSIRISIPTPVIVVAPPVIAVAPAVVVVPDNYVYYPSYGVYYNTSRHQYAYMDGGAWVTRPAPMGVSAEVLLASPSVKMEFHDSPANHHADMARRYPKSYKAGRSEQKADGREEHHDEHSDQHGDRQK